MLYLLADIKEKIDNDVFGSEIELRSIADLQDYLSNLQRILIARIKAYELVNPLEVLIAEKQQYIIDNLSQKETIPTNITEEFEMRFKEILQSQVDEVKGYVMEALQNISTKKTGIGMSELMSHNTKSNYNSRAISSHSPDVTYNSNAVASQSRRSSMAPTYQALTLKNTQRSLGQF